ncbi:MAG: L,D-transpeptidase [Deltaproteobacteria bacterium]|nr:L,D-transpeptidase [Deltaproteobacteria bacterium]
MPAANGPKLVSTALTTPIYERPDTGSKKIGYLRVGGAVPRAKEPYSREGCPDGWYPIRPTGFVCVGPNASLDLNHPLARAFGKRPDLTKALPYRYAFVRAIAPNYLRVPKKAEQHQYEFKLDIHLRSYRKLAKTWNEYGVGSNDVPLDKNGVATGPAPAQPPELSENLLYGGDGNDTVPWYLDGERKIPHLAAYKAPGYAVIAGRVARHTGLALIHSFLPGPEADERRMAVTTDGRLVPASKLKPNVGSTWHGVPLGGAEGYALPLAFVTERAGAPTHTIDGVVPTKTGSIPWRTTLALTGNSKMLFKTRFVELKDGTWVRSDDLATAARPTSLPAFAKGNQKWIDLSIVSQTIVAYEGERPVYVTMVSSGRDGLNDPKTTKSTVRGTFKVREKHVTTTMDANEVDNKFELRDVPWVQYFEAGYALHAAYWHDDFGKPRSHGCVNLSPIDAHWFFLWSTPSLPTDWHAVYGSQKTGEGTIVYIHP